VDCSISLKFGGEFDEWHPIYPIRLPTYLLTY